MYMLMFGLGNVGNLEMLMSGLGSVFKGPFGCQQPLMNPIPLQYLALRGTTKFVGHAL